MSAAVACGGVRVVCVYAPNGRVVGSSFYEAKLGWYERLAQWLARARQPKEPLVLGGDMNVAPEDADVWDPRACHGGTHVSPREREAFARLSGWGLRDAYRGLLDLDFDLLLLAHGDPVVGDAKDALVEFVDGSA